MKFANLNDINTQYWKELLDAGVAEGAFPCYAAAVGRGDEIFFRAIGGNRTVFPSPLSLWAIFPMDVVLPPPLIPIIRITNGVS